MTNQVNVQVSFDDNGNIDLNALSAAIAQATAKTLQVTEQIVLNVRRNEEGVIDSSRLLTDLEDKTNGEIKITDWIDLEIMKNEYPHLSRADAAHAICHIDIGDYDDAINRDIRLDVLNEAVERAGFSTCEGEGDEEAKDDEAETPAP